MMVERQQEEAAAADLDDLEQEPPDGDPPSDAWWEREQARCRRVEAKINEDLIASGEIPDT